MNGCYLIYSQLSGAINRNENRPANLRDSDSIERAFGRAIGQS